MSSYGLKVSKVGQNVGTVSDKNLQFTSDYSGLKLYEAGTLSISKTGTATAYGTINHNLGFEPAHFVWRKFTAYNPNFGTNTYPNAYSPIGAVNIWNPEQDYTENINSYTNSSALVVSVETETIGTYDFKYYYLVDRANDYSGTMPSISSNDFGIKISKPGVDVGTAKEYDLIYSSKYKALQYYDENIMSGSVTLPIQFSSPYDNDVYSGGYIDFYHGLGYQPFFFSYWKTDGSLVVDNTQAVEIPFYQPITDIGLAYVAYSSFATDEFIRLSFYRETHFNSFTNVAGSFPEETATFKLYTMTENLSRGSL